MKYITASQLQDFYRCPYRLWRDVHTDSSEKDPESDFARLLWRRGSVYEKDIVGTLGEVLDLGDIPREKRFFATREAMFNKVPLIYHGRLEADRLVGEPDLLKLQKDGTYLPIDIKSGNGVEGEDGASCLKEPYALQLALYADALIRLGHAKEHRGEIMDASYGETAQAVEYDLDAPHKPSSEMTLWEMYREMLADALALIDGDATSSPALGTPCKLCHWHSVCKREVFASDDLTKVFELGRSARDGIVDVLGLRTVADMAEADLETLLALREEAKIGKRGNQLKNVGEKKLMKFIRRAQVYRMPQPRPIVHAPVQFPEVPHELYLDIEDDPTRDVVYLFGIYERREGVERFVSFVAEEPTIAGERAAWEGFWKYLREVPTGRIIYHYGHHEPTSFKRLALKHPGVATVEDVEAIFDKNSGAAVDLYSDIIAGKTDWPLHSYSVKNVAQYLGFSWRDENPSGAASIEWFDEYIRTRDPQKLQRILDYNEDDCKAMLVIRDAVKRMSPEK